MWPEMATANCETIRSEAIAGLRNNAICFISFAAYLSESAALPNRKPNRDEVVRINRGLIATNVKSVISAIRFGFAIASIPTDSITSNYTFV
jgi:hypothetical protein